MDALRERSKIPFLRAKLGAAAVKLGHCSEIKFATFHKMRKRRYGRTGLFVSEICLGAGRLRWLACNRESYSILDRFIDVGGNFIQTSAHEFPPGIESGPIRSENIVGSWLKEHPGLRENLVLSARIRAPRNVKGVALEAAIRRELEESLRRLGTHYIDVLLIDWSFEFVSTEAVMSAAERLANAGMFRYAGSINFPCWKIAEWLGRAGNRGGCRLEAAHLEGPSIDSCLSELAREHKVAIVPRWPFPSGYEPMFDVAKDLGTTPLKAGIAWLLSRDVVTSVQLGVGAEWQVLEANRATELELSKEELAQLEGAYLKSEVGRRRSPNDAYAFRSGRVMC